ncbi:aquaporin-10 [Dermatophagoides farinae]|uniref:Aquaporin n=1 Tax=Dermatophagoides farinae TaxID=6954 RepID=A0A2C9PGE6_DERFA|nr:aquaporin [Dermatophagoides farinae]
MEKTLKRLSSIRTESDILREFLAEFLGTLTFVCIGCSANAVMLQMPELSLINGPLSWGLALSVSIYVSGGVSGGHLNPAVSLGLASIGKLQWKKLLHYFLGQYLGAFVGSLLAYAIYNQTIDRMPNDITWPIFGTKSASHINAGSAFLDQIISTMFFLMIICSLTDEDNPMKPSKGLLPFAIGFINFGSMIASFSYNCGGALNPARDLMPRIMTAIFGWKSTPFAYNDYNYFWIPIVACHLGGILGCWIYRLMIGNHWK